jgi:hypothetical protein
MLSFGNVMVQYSQHFCHIPLTSEQCLGYQSLQSMAFSILGIDNAATVSSGIRGESYAAYILLHFLGHSDLSLTESSGILSWCIHALIGTRGQPTQYLAWAAFVKFSYIAYLKGLTSDQASIITNSLFNMQSKPSLTSSSIVEGESDDIVVTSTGDVSILSSTITTATTSVKTKSDWILFLQGVATCRQSLNSGDDSAQWAPGLAELLQSSAYLRLTFPRKMFDSKYDRNDFSGVLHKENVGMFWSMFSALHNNNENWLTPQLLKDMLSQSRDLFHSSEDEARANNAVRAELFAGFYRYLSTSTFKHSDRVVEMEGILTKFASEHTDKVSYDLVTDWADAILLSSVGINYPISMKSELRRYILDGFRSVVISKLDHSVGASDDSFTRLDSKLLLMEAMLSSENTTSFLLAKSDNSIGTPSGTIADEIFTILSDPQANLLQPYRSTRIRLAWIMTGLSLSKPNLTNDFTLIASKLSSCCEHLKSESILLLSSSEVVDDKILGNVKEKRSVESTKSLYALEVASTCLRAGFHIVPLYRMSSLVTNLFPLLLLGSGHPDVDTVKLCHLTAVLVASSIKDYKASSLSDEKVSESVISRLFEQLSTQSNNSSCHVRETVLSCITHLMVNHWPLLPPNLRKTVKDILSEGLNDSRPEVQTLAQSGMVGYLGYKTKSEITSIAEAYTRNSDSLADRCELFLILSSNSSLIVDLFREKLRRKQQATNSQSTKSNPDKAYLSNIRMTSCVVLAFPYDMPPFLPALAASLVRHKNIAVAQDIVVKTIQMFKRTHQDR